MFCFRDNIYFHGSFCPKMWKTRAKLLGSLKKIRCFWKFILFRENRKSMVIFAKIELFGRFCEISYFRANRKKRSFVSTLIENILILCDVCWPASAAHPARPSWPLVWPWESFHLPWTHLPHFISRKSSKTGIGKSAKKLDTFRKLKRVQSGILVVYQYEPFHILQVVNLI